MQVQKQFSATGSATSPSSTSVPPKQQGLDALANESTFLQLLVSQVKNQDPLNPTDSVQFLSQLTQLAQLEQLVALRQEVSGKTT